MIRVIKLTKHSRLRTINIIRIRLLISMVATHILSVDNSVTTKHNNLTDRRAHISRRPHTVTSHSSQFTFVHRLLHRHSHVLVSTSAVRVTNATKRRRRIMINDLRIKRTHIQNRHLTFMTIILRHLAQIRNDNDGHRLNTNNLRVTRQTHRLKFSCSEGKYNTYGKQ